MPINKSGMATAVKLIGREHAGFVYRMAQQQDRMEVHWVSEAEALNQKITAGIVESLRRDGKAKVDSDLVYQFILAHYFKVVGVAAESAERELELVVDKTHLAKPPIPKSMRELRIIYDNYRKTGRLPKGLKDLGDKIKDEYLKKTQSVWRKWSENFRTGVDADQQYIIEKVEGAADAASSRAKTIVRTETTNYYNDTRAEIYDQSPVIWGYLFLAIRDQGTTKWCSNKVTEGLRGRHGLVYKKGDPLTDKERPSCHWNCRSEMVPLTRFNPRHLALIQNESLWRVNHKCHPLPQGWGNAS